MPVNTPLVKSTDTAVLRITAFGKVLRRTNLDELPQFINVMMGDMSLIGPRPGLLGQAELLDMRSANGSLGLRPGLTGWAQVNAYDYMPESEKARYDGEYAHGVSFGMDIHILVKTFAYLSKKPPVY